MNVLLSKRAEVLFSVDAKDAQTGFTAIMSASHRGHHKVTTLAVTSLELDQKVGGALWGHDKRKGHKTRNVSCEEQFLLLLHQINVCDFRRCFY